MHASSKRLVQVHVIVAVKVHVHDNADGNEHARFTSGTRLPGERASGGAGGHAGASSESEGRRWRATRDS